MNRMQLLGRRFDTAEPVTVEIQHGHVSAVIPWSATADDDTAGWPWIAPALIDMQFNGYGGQEFSSPDLTEAKLAPIVEALGGFGVARFCPTLTTQRFEVLQHALQTIAAACDGSDDLAARIAGIHLEGPYLSPEDGVRGAHPRPYCRLPDWDEFRRLQDAAGGRIRIVTMAVELEGAIVFIERVAASGVLVAIGHTAARPSEIRAAVDAGARMSTHLGNGCHPMLSRHENVIWEQLADDRLTAGLIVDGHHLPPAVVKTFVRAKTPERCILVSDIAGQAGLPPGRYHGNLCEVEVLTSGRLVMAGQEELMAGASLPITDGVANVMAYSEVGLAEAIRMGADQPARLLGIRPGGFQPGDPADLIQFDLPAPASATAPRQLGLRTTIVGGRTVFASRDNNRGPCLGRDGIQRNPRG